MSRPARLVGNARHGSRGGRPRPWGGEAAWLAPACAGGAHVWNADRTAGPYDFALDGPRRGNVVCWASRPMCGVWTASAWAAVLRCGLKVRVEGFRNPEFHINTDVGTNYTCHGRFCCLQKWKKTETKNYWKIFRNPVIYISLFGKKNSPLSFSQRETDKK